MLFNKQLYRYGHVLNTHDLLKIVALLLMIVDHAGWYLMDDNMICRLIGRGAAPIFFFLVGYSGKVHLSISLFLYGIILSFTAGLINHHLWINILLCFVLIHFSLHYFKLEALPPLARIIGFTIMIILNPFIYSYLEYGFLGFMIAYSARSLALKQRHAPLWMGASLLIYTLYQILGFGFFRQLGMLVAIGILSVGLFFLFIFYQLRPLPANPKITLVGLILARYSLPIYFYHLIIFQGVYLFTHPILFTRYFP